MKILNKISQKLKKGKEGRQECRHGWRGEREKGNKAREINQEADKLQG